MNPVRTLAKATKWKKWKKPRFEPATVSTLHPDEHLLKGAAS
jgi:hypothetical protein